MIHSCRSSVRCSVRDADGTCQEKRRVEPNYSRTSFTTKIQTHLKRFKGRRECSRGFKGKSTILLLNPITLSCGAHFRIREYLQYLPTYDTLTE